MDLEFTQEQSMLRSTLRGMLERECSPEVVREMEDHEKGYPDALWAALAGMDLLGLTIPEEYGGSNKGALENAILYEEFGRSLAPTPHLVSSVIGASVLARAGSVDQRQRWLPQIASGKTIFTSAWLEPDGGYGPEGVRLRGELHGDTYDLSGTKIHVPFANSAERLIVLARSDQDPTGLDLVIVDPASNGIKVNRLLTMAGDPQFEVVFNDVRVPAENVIGGRGTGWDVWTDVMNDVLIAVAAQAAGSAKRAFEMALEYSKQREQFGRPIGSFQVIAHYLADVATEIEGATILVYEAAWARAEGRDVDCLASMAKLYACDINRHVTAVGQQIFGGIGFIKSVDMQLYFRRAKQLQLSWWSDRFLEERIASAHLDAEEPVRLDPIGWGG